ncbi:MAG: hypothetical protein H0U60_16350 [Blastocatellia bacterium]|nr:hypothetical protein [Blastocatellia bacterium]
MTRRVIRRDIFPFIVFIGLTVVMTWPWARMIRDAVPDPGDAYLNSWILWWDYHQTFHDPLNLFQAPILFPYHYTLAFSENNYGIAMLFFPLFALGMRPITVQGFAELLGFILSGYGAFRLARTLSDSDGMAWVAGIVFGFAPYRFHQLGHLNYMFCGWIPLLLEALVLFARQRTWRCAIWLGIAFTMNALTCVHWFVLTLIPLGLSGAFLLTRYRIWRDRDFWLRGATCLVVAGLVLLPFLLPYQKVSQMYGIIRTSQESAVFSASVGNWLSADPANKIWRGFGPWPEAGERALFPGMLPLLLMIAAFYFAGPARRAATSAVDRSHRLRLFVIALDLFALGCLIVATLAFGYEQGIRLFGFEALRITDAGKPLALCVLAVLIRVCIAFPKASWFRGERSMLQIIRAQRPSETLILGLIWTVVGFCGSLGMHFFFHRLLFRYVFLFRSVRVPARWGMLAYLGIALLAGLGANRLVKAIQSRKPAVPSLPIYVIVCALLLFEQHAAPLKLVHGEVDPDALTLYFKQTPMRGGIVHLPAGGEEGNYRYVLRQADHNRPLVTAVSGFGTPILNEVESLFRQQPIPNRFLDVLEETPVSYLAVHRSRLRPEYRISVENMLGRGITAGRLRYIRSFLGTGINGNEGADLYAVVKTEPETKAEGELPFALPVREWDVLIKRDPINVLGQYQIRAQDLYRFYVASYGQMPRYKEFLSDIDTISRGVMIDAPEEKTKLDDRIRQFSDSWVERSKFQALYKRAPDEVYVDALLRNAGIMLEAEDRAAIIDRLKQGTRTRAQVLVEIVNTKAFVEKEEIRSLVLLHYFGYFHRNPDDPPDNNLKGFNFWVREIEKSGDTGRLARGFMAAGEYIDSGRK